MDHILEMARAMCTMSRDFVENAPRAGVLETRARDEAYREVSSKLGGASEQDLRRAAEALCLARTTVSVVAAVVNELAAACERLEVAFDLLEDARRGCTRAMKAAAEAADLLPRCSLPGLQKLQDESIELSTGHMVQALVRFQDQACEAMKKSFDTSREEL
eukprot:CAMPEP_0198571970 /NCGR_PEP_ID=MMETSP1462-20131121/111213_1 /TAXON_ID=1333877 /ORGANISM="Brandtodinium nutriculum, Strain RCC3387" /LENGTH=160 /DNA_ID=CAMNT_0044303119 /DNA_START=45 /DNA_END=524 /DNA_ORIENTATION=+